MIRRGRAKEANSVAQTRSQAARNKITVVEVDKSEVRDPSSERSPKPEIRTTD